MHKLIVTILLEYLFHIDKICSLNVIKKIIKTIHTNKNEIKNTYKERIQSLAFSILIAVMSRCFEQ